MTDTRARLLALVLATVMGIAALAAPGAAAGTASAANTGTIDSCTTIDSPGTYHLAGNIEDANASVCIEIVASDVTLDGNGYTIDGVNRSTDSEGIRVAGNSSHEFEHVTVTNVTVTRWDRGIYLNWANDSTVSDALVRNTTSNAVTMFGDPGNATVTNVTVVDAAQSGSGNGVYLDWDDGSVSDVTARNVTVEGSGGSGFQIINAHQTTELTDIRVNDTGGPGLSVSGGNVTVENAAVTNAGQDGEWWGASVSADHSVVVRDAVVVNATGRGLRGNSVPDVTVRNVSVRNTRDTGVRYLDTETVSLDGVSVDGSAEGFGVIVGGSTSATVANTSVRDVDLDGIRVDEGRTVLHNVSVAEIPQALNYHGVRVNVDANVTLDGVSVTGIDDVGMDIQGNESVIVNDTRVARTEQPGLRVSADGAVSLAGVTATDAEGIVVHDVPDATLRNVTVNGAAGPGPGIRLADTVGNATVRNSTVTETVNAGIRVEHGANATVRNTTVRNAGGGAVKLLGTAAVRGLRVGSDGHPVAVLSFDASVPSSELAVVGPAPAAVVPPADNRSVFRFAGANVSSGASLDDFTFEYADADAGNLDESQLRVWAYDGNWTERAGSVDTGADTVTATAVTNTSGRIVLAPLGPTSDPPPSYDAVAVSPSTVASGESFDVEVTVTNDGGEMLDRVDVTVDGTVVASRVVRLPGGGTGTVTLTSPGFPHASTTEAVFRLSTTATTDTANVTLVDADGAAQPAWTGWHLPPENDNYDPGLEPPRPPLSLAWNTSAPVGFNMPMKPLVVNDTVYATTYSGTFAMDARTGEVLWSTDGIDGTYIGGMAYEDGRLFVSTYTGTTALDAATGTVLWDKSDAHHNAPVVHDGTVYIPSYGGGNTLAVNATTGTTVWNVSYPSSRPAFAASLAVADGSVHVPLENGTLVTHDAATGAVEWQRSLSTYFEATPAVKDGVVYVADGGDSNPDDDSDSAPHLHALDADTGSLVWNATAEFGYTGLAVTEDTVYVATCGNAMFAYDATTGDKRWERSGIGCAYDISEPVAAEGVVYATRYSNETLALDRDTGEVRYTVQLPGVGKGTSPVPYEGRLYIADRYTTGQVYAFGGAEWPRVVPQQAIAAQSTELLALGEFRDDPVANATLTVDGTTLETGADGAADYTFPAAGTYEVVVTAPDTARHDYETVRRTVTVVGSGVDVGVDSTNGPVLEGETLTVNATVENTAGTSQSQTVTLSAGGTVRDSTTVTLAAGASQAVNLSWTATDGDAGDYLATVETGDTAAYEPVTVQEPATFVVGIDDAAGQLLTGETLTVNATVENTGDVAGTQTVSLSVGGTERDATTVSLGAGETQSVTLSWTTTSDDAGDYTATVASANTSRSATVSVRARAKAWATFGADNANTGHLLTDGPTADITARWRFQTDNRIQYSSAAVVDGTVYVGTLSGSLYAIDAENGTQEWAFGPVNIDSTPTVVNGTVYVTQQTQTDARLFAIDAENGTELWNVSGPGGVKASPTVANGTVYVGNPFGTLYALDAENGTERWNYTVGSDISTAPAVVDDTVYFGSDDFSVYALNATNGSLQWSYATEQVVRGSPTVANGLVYVGSNDGHVYAFDAGGDADSAGDLVWREDLTYPVETSPAVAGDTVYAVAQGEFDTPGTVYALDADTGARGWSYTADDIITSAPAVADGAVYVGSHDNNVYALDAATGTKLWNYTTGSFVFASPTVLNGTVYVGSDDEYVYALEEPTFAVSDVTTNAPVTEGETLRVNATVRNLKEAEETQTVVLTVGGSQRDSTSVTLAPDETTAVSLSWATSGGDAGDYAVTVASEDDAESTGATVESASTPTDTPTPTQTDDGGGSTSPTDSPTVSPTNATDSPTQSKTDSPTNTTASSTSSPTDSPSSPSTASPMPTATQSATAAGDTISSSPGFGLVTAVVGLAVLALLLRREQL